MYAWYAGSRLMEGAHRPELWAAFVAALVALDYLDTWGDAIMADRNRNIKAFFKDHLQTVLEPETVVTPAPPGWPKNADGTDAEFEWRILGQDEIEGIFAKHTKKIFAKDERGRLVRDTAGRPVQIEQPDNNRAVRNAIAEALVWPDMHSRELQEEYNVPGFVELLEKMFNRPDIWKWLVSTYNEVQGFNKERDDEAEVEIIKN